MTYGAVMDEAFKSCIICRAEKAQNCFNDEHVIPDSLGGYYHIRTVCVDCNSRLGREVDSPLVNHKLSELYRFGQEIAGKSGKVPNPFAGVLSQKDSPEKKARLDVGSDGNLELYRPPELKWGEEGSKLILSISIDPKDEKKLDGIVAKALARKQIPPETIARGEKSFTLEKGAYTCTWKIDVLNFKLGLLKIAYEFAVDTLPDYFHDDTAVTISQVLRDGRYEDALEYVKIGNGLQGKIWDPFNQYLDLDSRTHYLALAATDDMGLVCLIKLHDLFAIGVILSPKRYLNEGEMHIGINSLDKKSFIRMTGNEMIDQCFGPRHCRPLFDLGISPRQDAIDEVTSPHFRYEGQVDEHVPLYSQQGELIYHLEDAALKAQIEHKEEGQIHTDTYWFNPQLYYFVKALNTGNLYRIVAYEMVREQIKKL